MRSVPFQVVNVFAESTFGGNPLAVFPDARGLEEAELQALADQLNLSETTFVLPPERGGAARVRIFSPGYEMAFAGHPTLGTAHVLRAERGLPDAFTLELKVGDIPVRAEGDRWELRSAPASFRPVRAPAEALEAMLGLPAGSVRGTPRWVSTGMEQLLIPLRSSQAVQAARPDPGALFSLARNQQGQVAAYLFAAVPGGFVVRFFWEQHGAVREDPGTGSACANLGAWLDAGGVPAPSLDRVEQGHAAGRLNVLSLRRDGQGGVFVGGRVAPLMRGEVQLP